MANGEQLARLRASIAENNGCVAWNRWRKDDNYQTEIHLPEAELAGVNLSKVDLRDADLCDATFDGADLSEANLNGVDLSKANLSFATLTRATLVKADLKEATLAGSNLREVNFSGADMARTSIWGADLRKANFAGANLSAAKLRGSVFVGAKLTGVTLAKVDLTGADLQDTDLHNATLAGADLSEANLSAAHLVYADLSHCIMVKTNLTRADLSGARIHGISVWNVCLDGARQANLIVSQDNEPMITVDDLEVAQFIYLLLNSQKLRNVIETMARKVVLILGRFGDHLPILQKIQETLRQHNFLPILFDFSKSDALDYTETVLALANLSCFVIADFTEARSLPQELQAIVPNLPSLPVQPITQRGDVPPTMSLDFYERENVLPLVVYENEADLIQKMETHIIGPALAKRQQREERRKQIEAMLDAAQ